MEVTIDGNDNVTITGNRTVIITGGRGLQGVPGVDALERKLAIWKVRYSQNLAAAEIVELSNNITGTPTIEADSTGIRITAPFFTRAFAVHSVGFMIQKNEYLQDTEIYLIDTPTYIYLLSADLSQWAYIILEDMTQYTL